MKTRVVSVHEHDVSIVASHVIKSGGVVAYPTETAYAIGCSALNHDAAKKVFSLKQRHLSKPLPVIMASKAMAAEYLRFTPGVEKLISHFMPGPLTIVAPKTGKLIYAGDMESLAFRISSNLFARELSLLSSAPIVSTSANISGFEPVYEISKIIELFDGKVDLIVSGGDLEPKATSTIVDLTGKKPKILREGPIKKAAVLKVLKGGGRVGSTKGKIGKKAHKSSRAKSTRRKKRR